MTGSLISSHCETRPRHSVRTVHIALAGCGVVGSAFVRMLAAGQEHFRNHGLEFRINRVLVHDAGRERAVQLGHALFTNDVDAFLHTNADIVVEAMGGIDPALRIARAALQRGARFVTANKALVAAAGPELARAAGAHGGSLDFEACVAAGVPIIRTLRSALAGRSVRRIHGVLNGTTNYILNAIERGASFPEALQQAQQAGFAEADPARDLNGTDAREKLAILAWLAWGIAPASLVVRQHGIETSAQRLVEDAAALGGSVRLLAQCERAGEDIVAAVEPTIVPRDSDIARTCNESNLVKIEFDGSPALQLSGPGAGGAPTAAALLSDVVQSCGAMRAIGGVARPRADTAQHNWLLSVQADAASAARQLTTRHGDVVSVQNAGGIARMVVTCSWPDVQDIIRSPELADAAPVVSRLDFDL